jgi:PAS domain S-box-containing protein
VPAVFWSTDLDLIITSSTGAALARLGLRNDQLVGTSLREYLGTDDPRFPPLAAHLRALRGESSAYQQTWQDRFFNCRIEPLRDAQGRVVGTVGVAVDYTDQEHAERELCDSQQLLAEAQALAHMGSFSWDVAGNVLTWSRELYHIYGVDAATFKPSLETFVACVHPHDRALVRQQIDAALRTLQPFRFQERIVRPDGSVRRLSTQGRVIADAAQRPVRINGICFDITERHAAEQALRASEERYRSFFEDDLSGAFISKPDGALVACNPAFARVFGFTGVADALAANLNSLYPSPEARQEFVEKVRRHRKLEHLELELRHRTGRPVHVVENAVGTFDDQGELVEIHGYLFDHTERKRLEEQFRQAQKMEAVGRLAGGVAHDFNNLLTAILGYSDLLLTGMPGDSPQRPLVQEIVRASERAAELTRQLLAFSRRQVLRPLALDLNHIISGLARMLQLVLGEQTKLVLKLQPDLDSVTADPGQIEQVLMNLAVNARDAMPGGGQLEIATANVSLTEADCLRLGEQKPGPHVRLTVTDTGCGMPDEVKIRLFEPFFTTKGLGKGTGLGLATTYGIIKQTGGHIAVTSEVGRGSSFSILLPCNAPEQPSTQEDHDLQHAPRGIETLLLVEDDDGLRSLMRTILARQGYVVLEAPEGQEALTLAEHFTGRIHLLITDFVMPGMDGKELANRLAGTRPDTRILFLSGYADHPSLWMDLLAAGAHYLLKPFTPEALARKVRETLDEQV